MKILFLTSSLSMGGAERVATTLCNTWAEKGVEVTLIQTFSQASLPFYELSPHLNLIYLTDIVKSSRKTLRSYFNRIFALRKLIKNKQPDIIISFLPNVNVAGILASRFLKIPIICSERRNPEQKIGYLWDLLCKLTYPFADSLVVQTDAVVSKIHQQYPRVTKVRTIANPLTDEIYQIKNRDRESPRKIILSLSRLVHEKQIDKIIFVFNQLTNQHPEWDLHIYGDGPLKQDLANQIDSLNLNNRAFLKGPIKTPWSTLANEADIFISTSQSEGFPNTIIEAMAVKIPVITFDCPYGPREASDNGRNAVLIPLNDLDTLKIKLSELMNDSQLQTTLSFQAHEYVKAHYNKERILAQWDALILEITNAY